MKNNKFKVVQSLVAVVASAIMIGSASAAIVYDNSSVYSGQFFAPPVNTLFGDEINLAGTDRTITGIKFEYFANVAAPRTLTFALYQHDGANGISPGADQRNAVRPGAALYTSGSIALQDGFNTVDISGIFVPNVPSQLTFAVSFGGLLVGETAGLPIYENPTVGTSLDDFWQNSGGTWTLFRFPAGNPNGNFAAQITAIPEASTVYLAIAGGFLLFGIQVCRRSVKRV